ncbi:uncharacterized protein I303_107064 [Kwoniella dejecticola CBS 10117]|uniref:Uncharacterized protein n=1 Tax=Kwoniella dejecticola CBS 10117 TaxID=1296121 RepID=A0A1A5ZYM1_9TREE|nr:uncharacterized protein I303_06465 [Kwoniella dejecticola CBS 10117]OBR82907.1 hypothetical protein I303_06465 [Kwoniella dejecticola CBS 10117]
MVSLRQRKARASYSNVADGLEDLSSEDERAGSYARASGSKAGSARSGDEDDKGEGSSLSSGESSEFQPDSPTKTKGKGKAKDGGGHSEASESDGPASDEEEDEEMDDVAEELDDEDIEPSIRGASNTPNPKSQPSKPLNSIKGKRPPNRPAVSLAARPIHGQSEISLLSLQHRALIQASSISLTKPNTALRSQVEGEKQNVRERDQSRAHGPTVIPSGHQIPFQTRLTQDPKRGWEKSSVEWIDQSGPNEQRNENRRNKDWAKHPFLTFSAPWEEWKGEQWYPELFIGNEEEVLEQDRGKRENWLMRDEARLGLDGIGRWAREELHFVNEIEAEELYLPTPLYRNGETHITCSMGPHDQQSTHTFSIFDSKPFSATNPIVPREGHTFFAGGPIWGMDWCPTPESESSDFGHEQYLAVSTLPHLDTRPHMAEKWPRTSKGSIQIWSLGPASSGDVPMDGSGYTSQMKCEMVLCINGGPAMEIKWMPLGVWDDYDITSIVQNDVQIPKLGILSAVQLDGSVSLYAVPHPRFVPRTQDHPVYIKMDEPLLRLEIPDAMAMCVDWITGTKIAIGLSTGHLAVWDVYDALRTGHSQQLLPSLYTPVASSAIRSISIGRTPPSEKHLGAEPIHILMGAYDGSTTLLDLRDPTAPIELNRARIPCMAVKWISQLSTPVICDIDYAISIIKIRGTSIGRSHILSSHRGQVWDIGVSDYHSMLVSAGSDGALTLSNFNLGFYRKRKAPLALQRLYEIDYSEIRDEYRLIDDFSPETLGLENATSRRPPNIAKRATNDPPSHLIKTAAWRPEVGIHKAVWNDACGLGKAGWVASGGASGLGRVEWIEGRWRGGRPPPTEQT